MQEPLKRERTFFQSINEALHIAMEKDSKVFAIGLGVPDGSQTYGTTAGLLDAFGKERVYDMPISENAVTGIILGAALAGMKPVMMHARFEFAMAAIDPLVNQAAKWSYMFGGKSSVPITIRIVVGRGWGQGAQHAQSLHAWFAHIPGLKVVLPSTPYDAKGLLLASIRDPNPVVFIEHRWLHGLSGNVPEGNYEIPLGEPKKIREGNAVTIVSSSYMTIEALKAANILASEGIFVDLIDLRTLNPFDDTMLLQSVRKTGRLIVCDHATYTGGFSAEIVSRISEKVSGALHSPPIRITLPDCPVPTTRALTNYYYPNHDNIVNKVKILLGIKEKIVSSPEITANSLLDVPNCNFKGPF